MDSKVAVVTGANKGIGFAIVKELCRRGVGTVYLTSRDKARGEKAVEELKSEGLNPILFLLEVTDSNSVKSLAQHLKQTHGGLDILVNNAAIITEDLYKTTYEDSKKVIYTNYNSLLTIQEHIYPLLKNDARVVNMSSEAGHISNLKNQYWIERLTKTDITVDDINVFVNWFLDSVKNGNLSEEDFEELNMVAYKVSKIAVAALTRIQQREIGRGISINSLHPGFVKTDMTKKSGYMTIEEASKTPAYLVLDADQSLKGKYIWFDKTEQDWADANLKLFDPMEIFEKSLEEVGYFPSK